MSHKGSSPRTLDLFEVTLTVPTPRSEPAAASAKPLALGSLSDAQLAQQLGQLLEEVQRRMKKGRGSRPELEVAVRNASVFLERHNLHPSKQRGRSMRPGKSSSTLQEGDARQCGLPFWRGWRRHKLRSTLACRWLRSERCSKRLHRLLGRIRESVPQPQRDPRTFNQRVLGSSPSALTIYPRGLDPMWPAGRSHAQLSVITW